MYVFTYVFVSFNENEKRKQLLFQWWVFKCICDTPVRQKWDSQDITDAWVSWKSLRQWEISAMLKSSQLRSRGLTVIQLMCSWSLRIHGDFLCNIYAGENIYDPATCLENYSI